MRAKRKKMLYAMFLLITLLMFLQGWEGYMRIAQQGVIHFAHKHSKQHHKVPHGYPLDNHVGATEAIA